MNEIDFFREELENRKKIFSRAKYLLLFFIFLAIVPLLINVTFLMTRGYYVTFVI